MVPIGFNFFCLSDLAPDFRYSRSALPGVNELIGRRNLRIAHGRTKTASKSSNLHNYSGAWKNRENDTYKMR